MKESSIRSAILSYLNSLSQSYFEISRPGSQSGKPDITGCLRGRYVAVEVKRLREKPTKLQAYKLKRIYEAGGIGIVAGSVEEIENILECLGLT